MFERTITATPPARCGTTTSSMRPTGPMGPVLGIFAQVTDITDRKRMEDALFDERSACGSRCSPLAMRWSAPTRRAASPTSTLWPSA